MLCVFKCCEFLFRLLAVLATFSPASSYYYIIIIRGEDLNTHIKREKNARRKFGSDSHEFV